MTEEVIINPAPGKLIICEKKLNIWCFLLTQLQDNDISEDCLEDPEIITKYYLKLRQNFPKFHFYW